MIFEKYIYLSTGMNNRTRKCLLNGYSFSNRMSLIFL